MDEQKAFNITGINVHQSSSPMKGVEGQYPLLNSERIRTKEELAQEKEHERQINYKIWYFTYLDNQIKEKMQNIQRLEWNLGKVKPSLPTKFAPRTTGVLSFSGKDAQKTVRPDRTRCQKMLIKKWKMDIKYFEEVQEEHLCLMKPSNYCGTQELDDMMESLVQRIEHGNMKWVDETKIIQEINNFKKNKESYITPNRHWYHIERISKRDIDQKRAMEHKINIRLDDIEKLKRELIGREARVRRLKAEQEHVRKNISYLSKKLEKVDLKIPRAYKRAEELGDHNR